MRGGEWTPPGRLTGQLRDALGDRIHIGHESLRMARPRSGVGVRIRTAAEQI